MHRRCRNATRRALVGLAWILASTSASAATRVELPRQPPGVPWPTREWPTGELPGDLDRDRFSELVTLLFADRGRGGMRDTRALLVVQGGRLVFERYAEEFGPGQRFRSWSMAKSVTHALVGVLAGRGLLDVDAPAPVPGWQQPGDPRAAVTLDDLLHMTSGLDNADGHEDMDSFAGRVLFGAGSRDPAAYAADVALAYEPGSRWAYSTGTSSIVAAIAGRAMAGGARDKLAFMRSELFAPIGMTSVQPEFALSGDFVGGAFVHATARDWARLGTLYLRDGVWEGRRILPEGWVDYARTPAPAENNRTYGAHFWLNEDPAPGQWKMLPGAPPSVFAAEGASFQLVAIAPSRDLVLVRLGEAPFENFPKLRRWLGELIALFPPRDASPEAAAGGPAP